jgi:hypothetical protein
MLHVEASRVRHSCLTGQGKRATSAGRRRRDAGDVAIERELATERRIRVPSSDHAQNGISRDLSLRAERRRLFPSSCSAAKQRRRTYSSTQAAQEHQNWAPRSDHAQIGSSHETLKGRQCRKTLRSAGCGRHDPRHTIEKRLRTTSSFFSFPTLASIR